MSDRPTSEALMAWRNGVDLDGKRTLPASVIVRNRRADRTLLEITLTEGRNRQIRRVATLLGYPVIYLHRTRIGNICIDDGDRSLNIGSYRHLHDPEVQSLRSGDRQEAG